MRILALGILGIGLLAGATINPSRAQDGLAERSSNLVRSVRRVAFPNSSETYPIYDRCDIERYNAKLIRMRMMVHEAQAAMECEGEELSQTRIGNIRQVVLFFRGSTPDRSMTLVFQNNRLVHYERGS